MGPLELLYYVRLNAYLHLIAVAALLGSVWGFAGQTQAADFSNFDDSSTAVAFAQTDNAWYDSTDLASEQFAWDSESSLTLDFSGKPTDFGPDSFGMADDSESTDQTDTVVSLLKLQAPLVPIYKPSNLNPGAGTPIIVTPEPNAFASGIVCLAVIGLAQRVLAGRIRLAPCSVKR